MRSFGAGLLVGVSSTVLANYVIFVLAESRKKALIEDANTDPCDSDSFQHAGHWLLNWIVHYRKVLVKELPVISKVEPNYLVALLPAEAPRERESWSAIFSDIQSAILPGLTHWESSSKFFAYFKPHSSYPAVLGELLCAGINVVRWRSEVVKRGRVGWWLEVVVVGVEVMVCTQIK
jgi:hypothetical protein